MCSDEKCPHRNNFDSCTTKCNTDSNNDDLYKSYRGHISITPQMIHGAVKKLLLRKVYVNSSLIGEYLRRSYPVDSNIKTFNEELNKKLDCAAHVGLIIRYGENAYYLPTLRQEANRLKAAFSAFWETYKNYNKSYIPRNGRQGKQRPTPKKNTRYLDCSKSKR